MNIDAILSEKKDEITKRWIQVVLATYESPAFLGLQKDRFANPIGYTVTDGLGRLLTVLLSGDDLAAAANPLEEIIKIRAVQDFAPSMALSFVFDLKRVVREVLTRAKVDSAVLAGMADFDARVDALMLMAFDLYMASRERLFQVRINELKNGNYILTDKSHCPSDMLRKKLNESAEHHDNLHSST